MNDKRKEYLKKWREDNKEHIRNYKKEYAKTHDSSFKKLQDKYKQLQQENKILKENAENNDKVVDKVNWENMLLKKENKQLKDELKNKPDTQITLQDDKGNKFMIIQTERIDMQVELNKTIEKLFNNWNALKEYLHNVDVVIDYSENYDGRCINYDELIDKMQEMEKNYGNVEDNT